MTHQKSVFGLSIYQRQAIAPIMTFVSIRKFALHEQVNPKALSNRKRGLVTCRKENAS